YKSPGLATLHHAPDRSATVAHNTERRFPMQSHVLVLWLMLLVFRGSNKPSWRLSQYSPTAVTSILRYLHAWSSRPKPFPTTYTQFEALAAYRSPERCSSLSGVHQKSWVRVLTRGSRRFFGSSPRQHPSRRLR